MSDPVTAEGVRRIVREELTRMQMDHFTAYIEAVNELKGGGTMIGQVTAVRAKFKKMRAAKGRK